ncbi:hypothetical protein [Histidinibacterium lentulum]|nr:hypothetical protein [Histidinibacterium lentulum]
MDFTKLDHTKLLGFRLQDTAGAETTGLKKGDKGNQPPPVTFEIR